jgi:hypothetical protein
VCVGITSLKDDHPREVGSKLREPQKHANL